MNLEPSPLLPSILLELEMYADNADLQKKKALTFVLSSLLFTATVLEGLSSTGQLLHLHCT